MNKTEWRNAIENNESADEIAGKLYMENMEEADNVVAIHIGEDREPCLIIKGCNQIDLDEQKIATYLADLSYQDQKISSSGILTATTRHLQCTGFLK